MANTAYICRVRTDIPAGVAQVTDLHPNTSQRSLIYQPNPQSGYVPLRVGNEAVANAAGATTADATGLTAYLLDVVNDEASGNQISAANAATAATAIIALVDAGSAINETSLNNIFVTAIGMGPNTLPYPNSAGTAGTASLGTLKDLLKVCSGGVYELPEGSDADPAAPHAAVQGAFNDDTYRQLYSTGSLQISCGQGVCSVLASAAFSYIVDGSAVTGRAITVYDYEGNVLA